LQEAVLVHEELEDFERLGAGKLVVAVFEILDHCFGDAQGGMKAKRRGREISLCASRPPRRSEVGRKSVGLLRSK